MGQLVLAGLLYCVFLVVIFEYLIINKTKILWIC